MKKLLIILIVLLMCGCGKKPITSKEFKNILRDNNFYVINSIKQFSEYDYIKESYVANNNKYQIEFYVLSDSDSATVFFDLNKDEFEIYDSNDSIEYIKDDYRTYELTTEDMFMYLSKINNTVLYVNIKSDYKENAKNIIKKIGY